MLLFELCRAITQVAAQQEAVEHRLGALGSGDRVDRRQIWPGVDAALASLEVPFEVKLVRGNDERTVQVGGGATATGEA